MNAFVAYKNRCSELAEFPCLSCTKLCFKRECVFLDRCKQPVTGNAWNSFIQYLDSHPAPDDSLTTGYICKFCIEKFRNNTVPSRCMLNGLESNDNAKSLVSMYENSNHTPIDSSSICNDLANMLSDHNPVEFLITFVRQYSGLLPLIEHCVRTETVCSACNHSNVVDKKEMVFDVSVQNLLKQTKLTDLLQTDQNWYVKVCSNCKAPCKSRRLISHAGKLLVLKFDVWDPTGKVRRKADINCVPNSSVKYSTSLYKPKTSVHYEQTRTPGSNYVSIVSVNKKWLHCHDQILSVVQWPKGARDMYLLFLECTSVHNDNAGKMSFELQDNKVVDELPSKSSYPVKRKVQSMFDNKIPVKRKKCPTTDCVVTGIDMPLLRTEWPEYRYYPVDEEWQRYACR